MIASDFQIDEVKIPDFFRNFAKLLENPPSPEPTGFSNEVYHYPDIGRATKLLGDIIGSIKQFVYEEIGVKISRLYESRITKFDIVSPHDPKWTPKGHYQEILEMLEEVKKEYPGPYILIFSTSWKEPLLKLYSETDSITLHQKLQKIPNVMGLVSSSISLKPFEVRIFGAVCNGEIDPHKIFDTPAVPETPKENDSV